MKVSVVCPFFNEETIIVEAVQRMGEYLTSIPGDIELIVVNDGSTDDGLARLIETLEDISTAVNIKVLSYPDNRGRGHALRAGIKEAKGDIIVTTEVDLSWGNDIVHRLVSALEDNPGYHFVVASPHQTGGGFKEVPRSRILLSYLGNLALRTALSLGVTMHTGMTRAYRRGVIQPLQTIATEKDFHLEVLLKLISLGFRCKEIPATISWEFRSSRQKSRHKVNSTVPLKTIGSHLLFLSISQPVRYFSLFSLLSFLISVVFLTAAILRLMDGGVAIYMALLAALMLLFSTIFYGFSAIFSQLSGIMRAQWASSYPNNGEEFNSPARIVAAQPPD